MFGIKNSIYVCTPKLTFFRFVVAVEEFDELSRVSGDLYFGKQSSLAV